MFIRRAWLSAAVLPAFFLICPFLKGQATGSISGIVADVSGSVVAGARVTISESAMGLARESLTDQSGQYVVPVLPV